MLIAFCRLIAFNVEALVVVLVLVAEKPEGCSIFFVGFSY